MIYTLVLIGLGVGLLMLGLVASRMAGTKEGGE